MASKCFVYCRVSTREQGRGVSLDVQEEVCRAKIIEDGGSLSGVVFETVSAFQSGMKNVKVRGKIVPTFKPQQKALFDLLKSAPKGSKIYFYHADRLSRSLINLEQFQLLAANRNITFVMGIGEDEWTEWKNGEDDSVMMRFVRQGENESKRTGQRVLSYHRFVGTMLKRYPGVQPYFGGTVPFGMKKSTLKIHGKQISILIRNERDEEILRTRETRAREIFAQVCSANPDWNYRACVRETRRLVNSEFALPGHALKFYEMTNIVGDIRPGQKISSKLVDLMLKMSLRSQH